MMKSNVGFFHASERMIPQSIVDVESELRLI